MLRNKLLRSALLTLPLATALISAPAQAVMINPNNAGQLLIAPIYHTWYGFDNVVSIANMDMTNAVKAKLVLRSAWDGRECRDVILYLTPGDVAKLKISPDPDDHFNSVLYSDDDSFVSSTTNKEPTFASQAPYQSKTSSADLIANRKATGLDSNGQPDGDHCAIGHIEIIGAYAVSGIINTPSGPVTVRNGMAKGDLYKIFSTPRAELNALNPSNPPVSGLLPGVNLSRISLHGSLDVIVNNTTGNRITVPMTALISSNDDSRHYDGPAYLIGNENFDVTIAAQTLIGDGWGVAGIENLLDIEAPLNANAMKALYDNTSSRMTNLIITFPTKYRHLRNDNPLDYILNHYDKYLNLHQSPFHDDGAIEFSVISTDNFENSVVTMCWDTCGSPLGMNFITGSTNYVFSSSFSQFFNADQGWFSFSFMGRNPPVPAIAYTHSITNNHSTVSAMHRE